MATPSGSLSPLSGREVWSEGFTLSPTIPAAFEGKHLGMTNLGWRANRFDVHVERRADRLSVRLVMRLRDSQRVTVHDDSGAVIIATSEATRAVDLSWEGVNGAVYTVQVG